MKNLHTFEEFLNESKKQALFAKGDEVTITTSSLDAKAKKYNGKKGRIVLDPMTYSDGSIAYMVKVGNSEVEFRETELKQI